MKNIGKSPMNVFGALLHITNIMNLSAQTSNGDLYQNYTKGIVVMK